MADLTTLEAVKDYLGMDAADTSVDGQIGRLIKSESQRFVSMTNNAIVAASYTETRDGTGTRFFVPRNYPVISVQSITVDGEPVPQRASFNDTGWTLVGDRIELVGYYFTSGRSTFSAGSFPPYSVSTGIGNVTVTYTAGYAEVPADVDQAVAEMVARKMKEAQRIGLMTQSVGGETVSYQTLTLPESIQSVVNLYSRPSL